MNFKKSLIVAGLNMSIFFTCLHGGQAVAANFSAPQQLLKFGMRGTNVQILQERLRELNYFRVEPTAYFGTITLEAVKEFQRANGLKVDGIVGSQTWKKLENAGESNLASRGGNRSETTYYIVEKGDTLWLIAQKFNTDVDTLSQLNGLQSTMLQVGQKLVVPSDSQVSRGERVKPGYGELLPWFGQVENIFPRDGIATITDLETGLSFQIRRTGGYNHADCEPLSLQDTQIMKRIYGGNWSWNRRAVVVTVNGRRIAASMAGMPHAGRDDKPYGVNVSGRSGGYGTGTNLDKVKGNGMDGHFDLHFLGSKTHSSNKVDPNHQAMVRKAAGE
ncbi:MAG TPA: LysM peptidoglycan-binding domain-containing protein [Clostridia bacterium]|jgi:LysM repeat protein|nr:LysM peptidoglycan-binding domain-containing protein [Clostridia bacterium]